MPDRVAVPASNQVELNSNMEERDLGDSRSVEREQSMGGGWAQRECRGVGRWYGGA